MSSYKSILNKRALNEYLGKKYQDVIGRNCVCRHYPVIYKYPIGKPLIVLGIVWTETSQETLIKINGEFVSKGEWKQQITCFNNSF